MPLTRSASNPNYFARPDGTPIYFVGSHHWSDLQDQGMTFPPAAFDYTSYINWMQSNKFNFMRMWNIAEQPYSAAFAAVLGTLLCFRILDPVPALLPTANSSSISIRSIKPISTGFERKSLRPGSTVYTWTLYSLMDGVSMRKTGGTNPWTYHPSM